MKLLALKKIVGIAAALATWQAHAHDLHRPAKSTFQYVYSFVAGNDGPEVPNSGALLDMNGTLIGVTSQGGPLNDGTVYSISPSGTLTILHEFSGSDGSSPLGGVVADRAGYLYGTTETGSTSGSMNNETGSVFQLAPNGTLTTLHDFTPTEGQTFTGVQLDLAGNLYGVTTNMIYEILTSGTFVTLFTFDDSNRPSDYFTKDKGNDIYFPSGLAGPTNDGAIFLLPKGAKTLTALHVFNGTDGALPVGAVVLDAAGDVYGTTKGAANHGDAYGTVFKITNGGTFQTLHQFSGSDGAAPIGLTGDSTGDLYGTTSAGGLHGFGTIYTISAKHGFKTLYNFTQAGAAYPVAPPTIYQKLLYGTTVAGSGQRDTGIVVIRSRSNTSPS